jgi:hypothetical protein
MGEMKSAYDRAMERAGKLGKLSPDEMKKQEEERLLTVGRAIADKYLGHGHAQVFKDDIDKFRAEDRVLVAKGARLGLAQSLSFDKGVTMEAIEKVAEGLVALVADKKSTIDELIGSVKKLLEELEAELDRTYSSEYSHLESEGRVLLQGLGISGSAVGGVNTEGSTAWQLIEEALRGQYNTRLELLKVKLSQAVA